MGNRGLCGAFGRAVDGVVASPERTQEGLATFERGESLLLAVQKVSRRTALWAGLLLNGKGLGFRPILYRPNK